MQGKQEGENDDLVDYNDIDVDKHSSHTPVQTPQSLVSEDEDEKEDDIDLEEGQKQEEDDKSPELVRIERAQREFEALSNKLSENGFKMRMKVYADPEQAYKYMPMTTPNRSLAEILQLVPLEDAAQISEFQGLVYMPEQFLEKYLLPTMQIRKLLETENIPDQGTQPLPGGPETAIMYSLYRQSTAYKSTEMDNKLRSLITHSVTDTSHLNISERNHRG